MKTLIAILFFAVTAANTAGAQEAGETDLRSKLMFGVKGGLNYSNVYDSEGEEFQADAKFGFAVGVFTAIPIGTYIGIQPELLFSQKGFQATGRILGSTYTFTRTTSYLDVPLLFSFKPSEFINIVAGPQYAYLLKQKDVFVNSSTSFAQEEEFENDNIRRNTLCFTGGLDLTMKHLVISGRAGWDLQRNNGDGTSATPRYKNVWYQATVGYRFYSN